jgi:hypothetical protein
VQQGPCIPVLVDDPRGRQACVVRQQLVQRAEVAVADSGGDRQGQWVVVSHCLPLWSRSAGGIGTDPDAA